MKKVLITGANGFIGSKLVALMSGYGIEIIALIKDKNEIVNQIADLNQVRLVYCEMNEIEKLSDLISDRDIDTCIHLAWAGSFGDQRADYKLQLKNTEYALRTVDTISKMGLRDLSELVHWQKKMY